MKSVEEYYYTECTHCNILVDMYLDKHVTTPGCQFYVDLYPPPTLSLPKICTICYTSKRYSVGLAYPAARGNTL